MSTTVNRNVAKDFAEKYDGIIWEIEAPAGMPAISMDLFNPNGEEEFLFANNMKLIIKDIKYENNRITFVADMISEN